MRTASSRRCAFAAFAALAASSGVAAQPLADWSLGGYNTLRLEHYEAGGDPAGRPYRNLGGQFYDDVGVVMRRQLSPWERQQVQIDGTFNESEYRGPEQGLVLERMRALWEKGDTALPFRAEGGDFFAFQSPRTVQIGLKGVQVELQPRGGDAAQSLQAFAGLTERTWRGLDEDQDWYTGLSWLLEDEPLGAVALNLVHNQRDGDPVAGRPGQAQSVLGIAWDREFQIVGQLVELDTEYARFAGDHAGVAGGLARDRSDDGLYAQLRGRADVLPLDWRVRFERYGEHFRPSGGAVTPDHRALEAHGAWRFERGQTLRLRAQRFTDALESANPTDTNVIGAGVSGPLVPGTGLDVNGSVDAFLQAREDRLGTLDSRTRSLQVSATTPVAEALAGRIGLVWTASDPRRGRQQSVRRQLSAALDWDVSRGPWRATLSPGIVLRHATGAGPSDDWSPTLAFNADGRGHRLRLAWTTLDQDVHNVGGIDSLTHRASATWTLTRGRHRFGLDADWFSRDPSPGVASDAWRVGATWTLSFERPARPARATIPAAPARPAAVSGPLRLVDIEPGDSLATARARLAGAGVVSPATRPGLLVYEARLFDAVERRQRMVLVHRGERVETAALVVDLDPRGDGVDAQQTFEDLREALLRRYGPAERRVEEGFFGPTLRLELAAGRFVRLIEWTTPGGVLRFGIPRRTDGVVRIEVQHARGYPPGESADWSIESLR